MYFHESILIFFSPSIFTTIKSTRNAKRSDVLKPDLADDSQKQKRYVIASTYQSHAISNRLPVASCQFQEIPIETNKQTKEQKKKNNSYSCKTFAISHLLTSLSSEDMNNFLFYGCCLFVAIFGSSHNQSCLLVSIVKLELEGKNSARVWTVNQ